MLSWFVRLQNLTTSEEGQDMVEYALAVALVALGATAGLRAMGYEIGHLFHHLAEALAEILE